MTTTIIIHTEDKEAATGPWHEDLENLVLQPGIAASVRDRLVLLGCLGYTKAESLEIVDIKNALKPLSPAERFLQRT